MLLYRLQVEYIHETVVEQKAELIQDFHGQTHAKSMSYSCNVSISEKKGCTILLLSTLPMRKFDRGVTLYIKKDRKKRKRKESKVSVSMIAFFKNKTLSVSLSA